MKNLLCAGVFLLASVAEAQTQRWEYAKYLVSYSYFTVIPYDKNDTSQSWGVVHYWFEKGSSAITYERKNILLKDDGYASYLMRITGIKNSIQNEGIEAFNLFGQLGWELVSCGHNDYHMTPNLLYKDTECYLKRLLK